MRTFSIFWRLARNFLAQLAIISLLSEQFIFVFSSTAYAAELPITPDGSTNTQIDRAANNVPIVNIAAPNAGGLSHNKFENYNVNPSGLILNNAIGSQNGVIQTQIGGLINDNANLAGSGAASVILNEVTSNNISQINGYTEIAGKKADLVLANPNGFVMNGSGFINVSRFTAVVGSSNQFNPNPNDLTFRLSDNAYAVTHGFLPKLTIMGAGIDLENTTSTDLVANVMNIVAPVYAGTNDVNLRTGDQTFNYLTKAVTSDNTHPGTNLPDEVAIDASALGKIQAGRIFIVATKEGFGIKYSGDLLASRAGITIDNQGNIDYNNIASEVGNISVTSQKGSITQRGISQTKDSGSDITLNAFGDITNYGQFVSARNINLTTSATFNNQSAALNLSDNDFTIDAVDFTNLGQIAANRDLNITATNSLTNSAQLVAARNLTLTAPQITNTDSTSSIYAGSKINATANNYLTNGGSIISLGNASDDGITISAKTLNNNQQIAARKNITINSDSLNNNTSNSSILALNNINLNLTSIDNSAGNIQALNNLLLRNLTLNAPTIASQFSVTNQASSITNTGGTFYAGTLLDFDLGNSANYTIAGTLESAGNLKIKANNITNQTNLRADGAIEIIATDKFTNGVLSGDNSNNKIIAGTSLTVTAANLLSNYGTLSSGTDLSLTSSNNNINNNASAEIIGGIGTLTLSAKNGTVNQNSLHSLVSNGNLTLDVTDFDNTGRVDIAGNFTLNVANNLINEAGALIYSGGNMELNVVNNLTNNIGAVIYSEGNLTIQKYATTNPSYNSANNKTNLIDNISAEITSYGGNVNLYAATLNNRRSSNKTQANETRWSSGCNFHNHECHYDSYASKTFSGTEGLASYINSGNNTTIVADTFLNDASNLITVNNININATNFNNNSQQYESYTKAVYDWWQGNQDSNLNGAAPQNYLSETYTGLVKAGGSITVTATSDISNTTSTPNSGPSIVRTQVTSKDSQLVNSLDVGEITSNGTVNIDISRYFNGPDNNGLFTKNPNPNGPLFETRSQFVDQSKFFGSDYFYQRIGLDLTDVQTQFELQNKRLVGDQFFQNKIISEQLATISKNSLLLSANGTDSNNEIKSLLDNAADEYTRLGLTYNQPLTQSQINSLNKDIVWFQTQVIDGATYIVPVVYLSQASRDALKNGNMANGATMYAGTDLTLTSTAGKITNQGSLTGNNVALSSSGDILNKNFSNITALNSLSLTSSAGSISNFSQIKAGGALSMTAAKDITNSSTVLTNDASLLNSGIVGYASNGMSTTDQRFINSTTLETAGISGGSIAINAGNDFTNLAANITATKNDLGGGTTTSGNLSISAGDDITIATLELRNRSESKWGSKKKGGTEVVDTTTNVGSEIASAGNLTLTTTGLGTNNEKATVDAKYATAQTEYNSNLVVYNQAVADYPAKLAAYNDALAAYNTAKSAGGFKARLAKEPTAPEVPVAPTAPVYSQIMASVDNGGSDIKIVGSNISTTTNGANITINANDSLNIASAVDSSYKMETYNKKGAIVQKSSININSSTTNVASNITSMGDVAITSGLDTNIIASNLSGSGSGSIISGGDTNIFNATDTSYSYSQSTKTRTGLLRQLPVYGEMISVLSTVYSPYLSLANGLTGGNLGKIQQAGGIDYNKSNLGNSSTTEKLVASNLSFGNNLTIGSNVDITVKASNLTTTSGDILLAANGDVNILSAAETSTTNRNYRDKSDRAKERGNTDNTEIKNISSTVTSGSDLSIISGNNTIIQSSKLSSGDDLTIDAGNNLILATAKDTAIKNEENKGGTAYTFSNGTSGYVDAKAVNNEITSNTNGTVNSNLSMTATNSILAQYRAGTMEDVISGANTSNQQLAYLKTVNDLAQADPSKVTLDPIADTMKQWDQTTRGLTGAGTAVVAIAAIAITVVTMGSGATIGAAMMTAVAASGAATASVAATNASMNTDSSLLGSTKSIASNTWKSTTSEESLQNMAIAALTAGAAFEASVYLSSTSSAAGAGSSAGTAAGSEAGAASNTATAANTTVYVNPSLSNATVLTSNTANSSSFLTNLGNATVKIGAATGGNILATSAIKGQSINEVIADQGGIDRVILNAGLQIVGEAGAMQIGNAAHGTPIRNSDGSLVRNLDGSIAYTTPTITQGQQIALHAALGCGIGTGMSGGGSGCAAGAAAGIIGELTSNAMYQQGRTNPDGTPIGFSRNTSIAMGGLSGSLASAFTSIALGDDDSKVAKNIYAGNFVGTNAAANNSTYVDKSRKIIDVDLTDEDTGVYIDNQDGGSRKDTRIGKTEFINEFIYPDGNSKGLPTVGYKITDQSINDYIRNLGNEGGGSVHQINPIKAVVPSQLASEAMQTYGDLKQLAADSHPNQKFDIKTTLGAYNGYELNGYIVSGRSAGNYLAGYNAALAKPWMLSNQFWLNETLTRAGTLHNSGNAGSEIPYSIRQITTGYENGKQ